MVTVLYPALVLAPGIVIYALAAPGPASAKVAEVARIMIFCGMFFVVDLLAKAAAHLP